MSNVKALKPTFGKDALENAVPGAVFALLIIQPLLDIVSYWANEWNFTAVTTAFRFLMFFAVVLYAFILSDRKKIYIAACAVMGAYFVLHAIACIKSVGGYASPLSDLNNFLRLINLPMFALAFITFFKKSDAVPGYVRKAFFVNLVILVHSVILSYMTGTEVYTYTLAQKGVMGWAAVHNSQSAIISFLVPLALYFAYEKFNKWQFYFTALVCFSFLFFVGTRVDYFSIPLIFLSMAALLLISGEKRAVYYIVLIGLTILSLVCYKSSVAYEIRDNHSVQMSTKQEDVRKIIELSEDRETADMILSGNELNWETYDTLDLLTKHNIHGIYNKYLFNMVNRYGFDRVFEKYNFSLNVSDFLDLRQQKRYFAEMAWEDSDLFTKCFGYEYITLIESADKIDPATGETEEITTVYDLENDFPAVFYYSGYVGFAIYIAFIAYFALLIIVGVITRFKKLVTPESGMVGIIFTLSLGVSQFSGNVLRRPNVAIYTAVILAYIYYLTVIRENVKLRDIFKVFSKNKNF